jgi:hypothetical protein
MASTVGWLIIGIVLIAAAVYASLYIGRRVHDPERLVSFVEEAAERGRNFQDPDARRSGMRWSRMYIPGFWCLALVTWPRTIDHLIRGEWNVITSGAESPWADVAYSLLFGGVLLCVGLGLTINYWNWPKLFVHPYFRRDPGLLRARRMRAQGVDVDVMYEASAERWRERQRRRGRGGAPK